MRKFYALANVARIDVATEEDIPRKYTFKDQSDEITAEVRVSEGEEADLRVRNVIHAVNRTEDIPKGYDIGITQAVVSPELLAIIDGGEWNKETKTYKGIEAGAPVERTPFTLDVFTEDKDSSGETLSYVKFTFRHCKGSPISFTFKDGEFFVGEMGLKSTASSGERVVEFEELKELPPENTENADETL